ncbi:MAG: RnfABCDGE type electron transport complex subunit D [Candidatus Omnitrophica bacterium]|nr:RnfABCDGE type electron transport complex subunit D [Candidatus Omnitrophota bacterium]
MNDLTISVSPHIHSPVDTRHIMKGVIKALIPALAAAVWFYRWEAVGVMAAATAGSVITEYLICRIRNRKSRIGDMSAVLTGLLLALVLPPAIPLWMAFLGGVFAIALGKEVFGGLGHNVFNPALLARAFLMAAFPVALTTWSRPFTLDTVTTATPLGLAKFEQVATPYLSLFLGNIGGCLGETSAVAILLGFGYLLYNKIIDYRIPVAYLGTVLVLATIRHLIVPEMSMPPVFHLLAGGLLFGAVFMATDPVTTPVTKKGRWIFGAGCGMVTMIIRFWGGLPEGVMYSILFMNAFTPLINRISRPRRFGTGGRKAT